MNKRQRLLRGIARTHPFDSRFRTTILPKNHRPLTMYLDYAENQAKRQVPMKMQDWVSKLDAFLQFNEYDVLQNAGKVSAKVAKELVNKAYMNYQEMQDRLYESDFDKIIKKLQKGKDEEK